MYSNIHIVRMGGIPYIQNILMADKSWAKYGALAHSMVPWGERSRPLTTPQVTQFSQGHGAALQVEWSQATAHQSWSGM